MTKEERDEVTERARLDTVLYNNSNQAGIESFQLADDAVFARSHQGDETLVFYYEERARLALNSY